MSEDQTIVDGEVAGEAQVAPAESTPTTTELQAQINNLVSNGSKRETALTLRAERAEKAAELGKDSDEYQEWEKSQAIAQGATEANQRAAYWQMKAQYPSVPENVYSPEMGATEMENAALKHMKANPGTATATAPATETHPNTPAVATGGAGGGAPTLTTEQRLSNETKIKTDYSNFPHDPQISATYLEWRRSKGR
jgi:hypothetical protein